MVIEPAGPPNFTLQLANTNLFAKPLVQQYGRKDALIIAIEATESMLSWGPRNDEEADTSESSCCLLEMIKVAYQLMKAKIISNTKDCIGLMVFNTVQSRLLSFNLVLLDLPQLIQ